MLFFDARPGREKPWTEKLWIFDLRTNMHFTLKTKPLKRADLDEFVARRLSTEQRRHLRKPTWSETEPQGRWRSFTFDEVA